MELRHLRYFIAVAEESNFTRAAERLHISQPPLSQQIQMLERELGVELLRRSSKGAELTSAGRTFLREAKELLRQAERAKTAARRGANGETGFIKVGYTGTSCFHAVFRSSLLKFSKDFPDISVSLKEGVTSELVDDVTRGNIDIAFIRPGRLPIPEVQTVELAVEKMVVALQSEHPLAGRRSIPLSALKSESFLLFSRAVGMGWFDEIINSCRDAGFEPIVRHEVPQIISVVNLIAAGMGVSLVPESIAAQINVPNVHYTRITGSSILARIALVTKQNNDSKAVENFLKIAKDEASKNRLAKRSLESNF